MAPDCLRIMRHSAWDKRGEGLAGLLIALLIVSVVAAFAVPRLWRFGTALRLDGEAARLATELMRFRETVMTRQPVHEDFMNAGGEPLPKFELKANGYGMRAGGNVLFWYPLPQDVRLICSSDVSFRMTGDAQPMTIMLQSGKEVRYVIIDVVGRVRVSPTPPEE